MTLAFSGRGGGGVIVFGRLKRVRVKGGVVSHGDGWKTWWLRAVGLDSREKRLRVEKIVGGYGEEKSARAARGEGISACLDSLGKVRPLTANQHSATHILHGQRVLHESIAKVMQLVLGANGCGSTQLTR